MNSIDELVAEVRTRSNIRVHNGRVLSKIFPRFFRHGRDAAAYLEEVTRRKDYFPWTIKKEEERGAIRVLLWHVDPNGQNGAEVTRYVVAYRA